MSARSHFRRAVGPAAGLLLALLAVWAVSAAGADLQPPLSVQWTFSMGSRPSNTTVPLIQGDRVYVSHGGSLYCLEVRTGAERWNFSPDDGGVTTSALGWRDLVIVGCDNDRVYALKAQDGTTAWESTCAGRVCPDPVLVDDLVVLAAKNMVYGLEPASGSVRWASSCTSAISFGPVTDGSMLYFLCQDGSVQSIDAAQKRYRWRAVTPVGSRTFTPTFGGRRVIVAGGRRIAAVARSGAVSWDVELPSGIAGAPAVAGDTLYIPGADGQIYTLRAASGAEQRAAPLKVDGPVTAPPLVTGNTVIAGTGTGLLYGLERESGAVRWVYRCRAPEQAPSDAARFGIYAPLVVQDGNLYCLTGMGDLFCFSGAAPDWAGPNFSDFEPEPGAAISGADPVVLTFAATDEGTGIDPGSLQASVDGRPVEIDFDEPSGVGTIGLDSVADGPHLVKVSARDFRGNASSMQWSFLTDASIAAVTAQTPQATRRATSRTRSTGTRGARGGTRGGARRGGRGR
jgi:outer membrane protein assembly factor BamB